VGMDGGNLLLSNLEGYSFEIKNIYEMPPLMALEIVMETGEDVANKRVQKAWAYKAKPPALQKLRRHYMKPI